MHVSVVPQLKKYDWPSDGDDTWRHITDYILYDEQERKIDLLLSDDTRGVTELKGMLVPPPEARNKLSAIRVHFVVENYAIDFGTSIDDPNRGFWLLGEDDVWYKLEGSAHISYQKRAVHALELCDEYIKFYDAAVYGKGSGKELSNFNERTMKFSCRLSVDELYEASNHVFDMEVLHRNAAFYLERATTSFAKDCNLMRSLKTYAIKSERKSDRDDASSSSSEPSPTHKKPRHIASPPPIISAVSSAKKSKESSGHKKKPAPVPASAPPAVNANSLKKLGRAAPKKIPLTPSSIFNHELLSGLMSSSEKKEGGKRNEEKREKEDKKEKREQEKKVSPTASLPTSSTVLSAASRPTSATVPSVASASDAAASLASTSGPADNRTPHADWLAVARDIQAKRIAARAQHHQVCTVFCLYYVIA